MSKRKKPTKKFHGYRVPAPIEALGEREFKRILSLERQLLMIGEQIIVYSGPERLDLLAIDSDGDLWVFEFKRDIARPAAVGQLLTYASYVIGLENDTLDEWFRRSSRGKRLKVTLNEAFRLQFKRALPSGPHKVCLVLMAFDFSMTCDRLLAFIEQSAKITIGRMKMEWVCMPDGSESRHYQYLQSPVPIPTMTFETTKKDYFLLSMPIEGIYWEWCRNNDLLLLEDLSDMANTGEHRSDKCNSEEVCYKDLPNSLPLNALKVNTVLFFYSNECRCWDRGDGYYHPFEFPPEYLDEEESWHPYLSTGLLGVGVIRSAPREIPLRERDLWRRKLNYPPDEFMQIFDRFKSVLHIEWIRALQAENAISGPDFPKHAWLRMVEPYEKVSHFLELLGADQLNFQDVWF